MDEDPGADPKDRKPCPYCGSTARHVTVVLQDVVSVSAAMTASVVEKLPAANLLVGQEFTPKGDPLTGLQQAYDVCNV